MVDTNGLAIVVTDQQEHVVVVANRQAEQILGFPPGGLTGQAVVRFDPSCACCARCPLSLALGSPFSTISNVPMKRSDGTFASVKIVAHTQLLQRNGFCIRVFDECGSPATGRHSNGRMLAEPHGRWLHRGAFALDLVTEQATIGQTPISLTPAMFAYLRVLLSHAPEQVGWITLVWQAQSYALCAAEAKELARWHIHELRQAIEPDPRHPRYILTVRGIGYKLAV